MLFDFQFRTSQIILIAQKPCVLISILNDADHVTGWIYTSYVSTVPVQLPTEKECWNVTKRGILIKCNNMWLVLKFTHEMFDKLTMLVDQHTNWNAGHEKSVQEILNAVLSLNVHIVRLLQFQNALRHCLHDVGMPVPYLYQSLAESIGNPRYPYSNSCCERCSRISAQMCVCMCVCECECLLSILTCLKWTHWHRLFRSVLFPRRMWHINYSQYQH